jgi:phosphoribosylformylglycinamidine cyclo-ligase
VKSVDPNEKAYARAGVDVDLGNRLKRQIQSLVRQTHGPRVLGKVGGFGGLFRANFPGMREPVLVASIDGVGTKLKIAFATNRHDTVGADLVNHCVNDIAALGARPLFFLDYIGCEKLETRVFDQLLRGFSRACRSAGCALIGGETAQMPGMYRKGEYDLAGCIVGVVDRAKIIDGRKIKPGDAILGLPSNGLHTNGYSLARKILLEKMRLKLNSRLPGSMLTVGEELLRVHKNYQPLLAKVPAGMIKGLAHITGGGLIDNLPRVLPQNCDAVIETKRWRVPRIFQILQRNGDVAEPGESRAAPSTRKRQSRQEGTEGAGRSSRLIQSAAPSGVERIDPEEMYQVFNMGIGMVAIVSARDTAKVMSMLKAKKIGRIEKGTGRTRLLF